MRSMHAGRLRSSQIKTAAQLFQNFHSIRDTRALLSHSHTTSCIKLWYLLDIFPKDMLVGGWMNSLLRMHSFGESIHLEKAMLILTEAVAITWRKRVRDPLAAQVERFSALACFLLTNFFFSPHSDASTGRAWNHNPFPHSFSLLDGLVSIDWLFPPTFH